MSFYLEEEVEINFGFNYKELAKQIVDFCLDYSGFPYEAEVNLTLTDNEGIHVINKEFRDIDRETDVLSFPNVDYESPADFSSLEEHVEDYFDPESGELCLGNIVISIDKVYEQAESYGHDVKREYAFLIAHSMLHLCGYDHMEPDEAAVMEAKQEAILTKLGITR